MDFWNNILRYPRFFLSSMLGLLLVLTTPLLKLSKEIKNQKLFFVLVMLFSLSIAFTLFLMLNPLN